MNLITIIYLITAFLFFESAIAVYRLHREAPLNRSCALLLILFTIFSLIFALFVASRSYREAWILSRISIVLSCFVGSATLHFLLLLGRYEFFAERQRLFSLIYAPAVILALYASFRGLVVADVYLTSWGWDNAPRSPLNSWDIFYFLYSFAFIAAGFIVLTFKTVFVPMDALEKRQSRSLLMFTLPGLAAVAGTGVFFTLYDGSSPDIMILAGDIPQAGLCLLWLVGLRYTMWKHKLLVIIPSAQTGDLFSGLRAPILLADSRGVILFANSAALEMISPRRSLNGTTLESLLEHYSLVEEEFINMKVGLTAHVSGNVRFNIPGMDLKQDYFRMQAHSIQNETGVYIGCLIMIGPAHGMASLKTEYRCTEREIEIIRLIDSGLSAPDIAELLNLSELTVKTHIHNVYRKTGAKNRVGLSHLIHNR